MLEGRTWYPAPPAARDRLEQLRQAAWVELPESYYRLLSFSDGGEGPLPILPYNLCLDDSGLVVEAIQTGNHGRRELDGFVVFGGDGGGNLLAFDARGPSPWSIVAIDMVAGLESTEPVAPDFDAFLDLIGREPADR